MNIQSICFKTCMTFCLAFAPLRSIANANDVIDSTVRILGATEGTGAIIARKGRNYQVVTAWHVLNSNISGEEVWIETSGGNKYLIPRANMVKLQGIDMAVLTFESKSDYPIIPPANSNISFTRNSAIVVAGWPLGSSKVRVTSGKLVSSADVGIDSGYALLYTNETFPGMSGGPVVNPDGHLLGIHGRGERNEEELAGSLKTGINQGIPAYFLYQYLNGQEIQPKRNFASSCDDYLAYARNVMGLANGASAMLKFANKAEEACSDKGYTYFLKAISYHKLGDRASAIEFYEKAYRSGLASAVLLANLAANRIEYALLGGGVLVPSQIYNELHRALELDPANITALYNLGGLLRFLGKPKAAREVIIQALSIYPSDHTLMESLQDIDLEIETEAGT